MLEKEMAGLRSEVRASGRSRNRLHVDLMNLSTRVDRLECQHHRTRTRVYAAHAYGRHVAHLVKVRCLDCGKIVHEQAHAIETTGI